MRSVASVSAFNLFSSPSFFPFLTGFPLQYTASFALVVRVIILSAQTFSALNPRTYALGQYGGTLAALLLILSAPVQVYLGLTIAGGFMFVVTAGLSLLLVLPLLLYLRATPPITLSDEGFTLAPVAGRRTFVAWADVREVKPYPLLPPVEAESLRKAAVGRKKYAAAEGIMLLSDALPLPYRAVGWFAGAGFRGAVALTNRSHTDYAQAKYRVERATK